MERTESENRKPIVIMIKINLAFYRFKPSEKLKGKKTTINRKYKEKNIQNENLQASKPGH